LSMVADFEDVNAMTPRERLLRLFQFYDPTRIVYLDILLKEYEGNEEELLAETVAQFGPEPMGPDLIVKYRLNKFYLKYNPTKLSEVTAVMQMFKGRESALFKNLIVKYGLEPEDPQPLPPPKYSRAEARAKVSAIYRLYAPEKLANLDEILERYRGDEENLLDQLAIKYNVGDITSTSAASASGVNTEAALKAIEEEVKKKNQEIRDRLQAIYKNVAPEKLPELDAILLKYRGDEENLFEQLRIKYSIDPAQEEMWIDDVKTQRRRDEILSV
jgi:hypothetical protein